MTDRKVKRGEIYYADLPETESGSVQAGRRPVLITQCDRLNRTSTTVLVAIVTSKLKRPDDERIAEAVDGGSRAAEDDIKITAA